MIKGKGKSPKKTSTPKPTSKKPKTPNPTAVRRAHGKKITALVKRAITHSTKVPIPRWPSPPPPSLAPTRSMIEAWALAVGVLLSFADAEMDDAIVGVGQQYNEYFVIYDMVRVIARIMARDEITRDTAYEVFEASMAHGWEHGSPCFLLDLEQE